MGTGTPTGTKRQESALWFNDGTWWGNLWDTATSDFHIFRFNAATGTWVNTGVTTETRANTHHDVLWDGTTLFVASYRFVNDGLPAEPNFPTIMRRYTYNSSTKTYTLQGSPQNINNQRTETLSIDKDSTGRVWATWQQANRIFVNVTGTTGTTWGTPFALPTTLGNVSVDDNSAVIAFGGAGSGKIGVMWSRQVGDATDGMYWSFHTDTALPNTGWSTPVAAVSGQRTGDDHMNLKWLDSAGGKVFAAVKTSFTSASQPLIQLLELTGTAWTAHTIATVSECPNRVIVLIDESAQKLRTFATYPKPSGTTNAGICTSSGGAIYEKSVPLSNINFSTAAKTLRIADADQYVHNVTSTKQNLNSTARGTANSGLLVLADVNATSRYWHYYDSTGGGGGSDTTAPTVTGTSPAAGATGVAATANVTGTFSEAMTASTVTSSTFTLTRGTTAVAAAVTYSGGVATLNPTADLAANTLYTATIKGGTSGVKDAAGNALASDRTWTFTTAAAGGGTSQTVTLTATADSYVSSGATGTNFGAGTTLVADNSPVETTYLKFDLSAYAGRTLQSATLQLRSAGNASTGRQAVKLVASDSWTESGITYSTRPALGTTSLGTLGPTAINTTYSIPLTVSGLTGELGQQLSLGVDSSSSDGLDLNSKEAGSTAAPKLVLTMSQ